VERSRFKLGKIGWLVDIDFSARKEQRDHGARRLHEEGAGAFVAAERAQIRKDLAGKYGGNAQDARIG
jgi:hypothetical protein